MSARLFLLLFCSLLSAQTTSLFHADARLAITSFRVSHRNHFVEGLQANDIVILEDGVPQKITLFESRAANSKVPLDLILLFDVSDSVAANHLLNPLAFQEALFNAVTSLRTAVYSFRRILNRLSPLTSDPDLLERAFKTLREPDLPWIGETIPLTLESPHVAFAGETWLYESITAAARDVAAQSPNSTRLMVVISDGLATTTTTPNAAAGVANELAMPIYPIVLGRDRFITGSSPWYVTQDFFSLGYLTGGHAFDTHISPATVRRILDNITLEVRAEYVVGFDPPASSGQPRRHRVEIRLVNDRAGKMIGGTRTILH